MGEKVTTKLASACVAATIGTANAIKKTNGKKALRLVFSMVLAVMTLCIFSLVVFAEGEGEKIANDMIAEISKWVVRISVVVIAFGGIKAGLGVANQSDNERNTGFMTIAGGAIMAAVAKIVESMEVG